MHMQHMVLSLSMRVLCGLSVHSLSENSSLSENFALSEDLCRKVVMNARVRLQEFVRQNGGHIEHVLH